MLSCSLFSLCSTTCESTLVISLMRSTHFAQQKSKGQNANESLHLKISRLSPPAGASRKRLLTPPLTGLHVEPAQSAPCSCARWARQPCRSRTSSSAGASSIAGLYPHQHPNRCCPKQYSHRETKSFLACSLSGGGGSHPRDCFGWADSSAAVLLHRGTRDRITKPGMFYTD